LSLVFLFLFDGALQVVEELLTDVSSFFEEFMSSMDDIFDGQVEIVIQWLETGIFWI
jgi:hypothetical protein